MHPQKGIPHTEEYKKKLSEICKARGINRGEKSGNFGKHWYTNGIGETLCSEQDCPEG